MEFRIADTFTESLGRLTGEEQKGVKTTAFDLQMNPASPGMSLHKLDRAKDKNFWSVRVSADIRLIVHKSGGGMLLCYVDHHDKAYEWAERRKLETHPKTGAAQIVEIRELVREIVVPVYVEQPATAAPARPKPALFASTPEEELLGYGVPPEWLADVRKANEETLLALVERLPAEAGEALLELATGGTPRAPVLAPAEANPFAHPDAQRRFRVMTNVEELERALKFPWEKWTVFLHPEQRELVERDYSGPARVSGSAGTGKTIVALHRAVHLARSKPDARILLATFSEPLAKALTSKLYRLVYSEPRLAERIEVHSLPTLARRLYKGQFGEVKLVSRDELRALLGEASTAVGGHKFTARFLETEWEQVVDAWQLATWEEYRDVARLGRKTRLPEAQRQVLWSIFERVRAGLAERKRATEAEVFTRLAKAMPERKHPPYDFAVVDEAQDLGVAQLRFFAALGGGRANALFFAGDLGQRIFQQPFSWLALGIDIRGRARSLRINYRTSHQIREQADRLLAPEVVDVDGVTEKRNDTISVFNGPAPEIREFRTEAEEAAFVAKWLKTLTAAGVAVPECGVLVRSEAQIARAEQALRQASLPYEVLDRRLDASGECVSLCTMHLAKGLEFRAVAVMGCDDEVIPLQERIETVGDDADLQEVYETERHLLYVACTRARDHLLVTSVAPRSEFLDDLLG